MKVSTQSGTPPPKIKEVVNFLEVHFLLKTNNGHSCPFVASQFFAPKDDEEPTEVKGVLDWKESGEQVYTQTWIDMICRMIYVLNSECNQIVFESLHFLQHEPPQVPKRIQYVSKQSGHPEP